MKAWLLLTLLATADT